MIPSHGNAVILTAQYSSKPARWRCCGSLRISGSRAFGQPYSSFVSYFEQFGIRKKRLLSVGVSAFLASPR
ncbi:hypothetical protein SBA6_730017 [Candidatus Sulfopaludibacter sp. SbA6]|nr:hypothetical protein SBA6_730017 [Candidatus Sulfopaludibacter sp. SbA6]